jgi:hypothetical protein
MYIGIVVFLFFFNHLVQNNIISYYQWKPYLFKKTGVGFVAEDRPQFLNKS